MYDPLYDRETVKFERRHDNELQELHYRRPIFFHILYDYTRNKRLYPRRSELEYFHGFSDDRLGCVRLTASVKLLSNLY